MSHAPINEPAHFMMCKPSQFEVRYRINPWMNPAEWSKNADALSAVATLEWERLHRAFSTLGARLTLIDQAQGLPDMTFVANAAIVVDRRALIARFRHPEREGETVRFLDVFARLKSQGVVDEFEAAPQHIVQEGAGDCLWDAHRQIFWAGFGPRSERRSVDVISDYFGHEVVPLELSTSEFYHLDVSMNCLPNGDIIYFPGAFSDIALGAIRERVSADQLIAVSREDADRLAVNSVCIGSTIVIADPSEALTRQLGERGFNVRAAPLTAFRRSGGSACCLTLRLDLHSHSFAQTRRTA
ncbi:MAG: arginine deiminase-related protein [Pseudomonadota bacterium]